MIDGSEILTEAYDLINGPRQIAYDHPFEDYSYTVSIFEALTGIRVTVEEAILFMVAVKMSRLRTNLSRGSLHRDSIVDAAGYLGCLSMAHQERQRRMMVAHNASL